MSVLLLIHRYEMMLSTWSTAPGKRPTFSQILGSLRRIENRHSSHDYYVLEIEGQDTFDLELEGNTPEHSAERNLDEDIAHCKFISELHNII